MFTIYSDSGTDSTMVSNLFIDEYMKSANDAQIKIYLYLLRALGAHRKTSVSDMADRFNHTEKDVVRSLRYWEKKGLLDLTFEEGAAVKSGSRGDGELVSICLRRPHPAKALAEGGSPSAGATRVLPFVGAAQQAAAGGGEGSFLLPQAAGNGPALSQSQAGIPARRRSGHPGSAMVPAPETASLPPSPHEADGRARGAGPSREAACALSGQDPDGAARMAAEPAPEGACAPGGEVSDGTAGTPASGVRSGKKRKGRASEMEALESFRQDAGRQQLLFVIEQYIGKPLSLTEIRTLFHISEDLHFSDEMIDYLLQYCVDRGKRDFRYIRKVAENWAREGISTPSQAEAFSFPAGADPVPAAGPQRGKNAPAPSGTKRGGVVRPRSSNAFNQFDQNSYDFDALEAELLSME